MAETVWPQKGPNSREALARIGACVETTITKIAGRFDEPLSPTPFKLGEKLDEYGEPMMDQGVHVLYQNGAEQIDSAWNAAVAHSKLGDPVRLCTVWKPKKCPPGDDRGTNLQGDQPADQRDLADVGELALLRRGLSRGLFQRPSTISGANIRFDPQPLGLSLGLPPPLW
ncbi:hypothetical protein [Bradyrhizobium aeschynomenes]|uniref:hypothetical protein n=1 Tax=Bradyrhizobium aeschynomenes TaxID=2734909 RepID=UPI001FEE002A|nr:hypothetical protein [Bradyrhizobium aeschynomenes]